MHGSRRDQRTLKRREAAIEDQLEVAEVTLCQDDGRQLLRLVEELGMARQVASKEVLEDAAVGGVCHGGCRGTRGKQSI